MDSWRIFYQIKSYNYRQRIRIIEIKEHLVNETRKKLGLEDISIEIRNCLGDNEIEWLTELFNIILKTKKCLMPKMQFSAYL